MIDKQFIEVDRVLSDKITKENVSVEKECVDISLIKTFRGWHKGDKDRMIKGEMTILILKPDFRPEFKKLSDDEKARLLPDELKEYESKLSRHIDEERKPHSMIIEESYSRFRDRMSRKVIVRKLDDAD